MNRSYRSSLLPTLAALGVGLGSLGAVLPAAAQTVTINHVREYLNPSVPGAPDPNNVITLFFDPSYQAFAHGGFQLTDYVGVQRVTHTGPNAPVGSFLAYCVDLPGIVGTTPYSGTFAHANGLSTGNPSVAGSVRGAGIAWLLDNTTVSSDIDSAALQLAIWKAEYDWDGNTFSSLGTEPNLSFFSGNFQYDTMPFASIPTQISILVTASNFLKNWGGRTNADALLIKTTEVSSPSPGDPPVLRQALIANIPVPAPEPGALSLLAAGAPLLGGILVRTRRRRRRSA